MSDKIKNYLGVAIIISVLISAYSASSYVGSYSKAIQPSSFRSFSVQGEGKTVIVPDIAEFNFGVITEGGKNLADLQKENTDKANKAIEFVKSNGVETKNIKTKNYNITPRYKNFYCVNSSTGECPPPEIVGYAINQTVGVKVKDFEKIGGIIAGVVKNGANSISDLTFKIDDPTQAENDARKEAISKAKEKAKAVAEAGGFRLGRLLSIDESNNQPVFYGLEAVGKGGDAGIYPSPVIEPGSQEIIISVFLRYEIQ